MPNNLPLALDSFVGRMDEMERLRDLMDQTRMVTLTGAPGIGKTRLATEVAREAVRCTAFPDGVWMVPLAPLADVDQVLSAVAALLGTSPGPTNAPYEPLIRHLAKRCSLLLLDNCEHVVAGAARMAAALLERCPDLTIVATSQQRLGVAGEQVWPVSGLAVPAGEPSPAITAEIGPSESMGEAAGGANVPEPNVPEPNVKEAMAAEAVRLFEARARSAAPNFVLDDDNVGVVAQICRRLDGIPLAIELAAARVDSFSPAEIARHLDDRFVFLTGGSPAALPRHQTLRAAVDWSYDLLDKPQQALLRRLSLFPKGATLEAIERVCAGGEVDVDGCTPLVTSLAARSLVVAHREPPVTRYGLLETIRLYGRERLAEAGDVTATATRYVEWAVDLAEAADANLQGPDQRAWFERVDDEGPNLQEAMRWSLEQGPTEAALRIATALVMFCRMGSYFSGGRYWLEEALAVSDDAPVALRARALWGKALMELMVGDSQDARMTIESCLLHHTEIDDPRGFARALLLRASIQNSDPKADIAALQHVIAIARQVGDGWCLSHAMANCGLLIADMGDASAARQMLEEAVAVARLTHDRQSLSFTLFALGRAASLLGDLTDARGHLDEILSIAEPHAYESLMALAQLAEITITTGELDVARSYLARLEADSSSGPISVRAPTTWGRLALAEGDLDTAERIFGQFRMEQEPGDEARALRPLAEVAIARGDARTAHSYASEALESDRAKGYKQGTAEALHLLGRAEYVEGRDRQAESLLREALHLRLELGDRVGIADSLDAMAAVYASIGQPEKAAVAFGCVQALRDTQGYARTVPEQAAYEETLASVRAALGPEAFDAAWAKGTKRSPESALTYLTRYPGARPKRPPSGVASLTEAERQVASLVLDGLTNADIGARLYVSIHTVKTHVTRIYAKLGVTGRSELLSRYSPESL